MVRSVEWTEDRLRFRRFVEDIGLVGWITASDGYCLYISPAWCDFTGQPLDEAINTGWMECVHEDDRVRTRRTFYEANDSHVPFATEYRIRTADGRYVDTIARGMPIFDSQKSFVGFFGFTVTNVKFAGSNDAPDKRPTYGPHLLSAREREVLLHLAAGFESEEIAHLLDISHRTVGTHAHNAVLKLHCANRIHAVVSALERGEITFSGVMELANRIRGKAQ